MGIRPREDYSVGRKGLLQMTHAKDEVVEEILEYLHGPYTMRSGFIDHVRKGLSGMAMYQLENLLWLIKLKKLEEVERRANEM